MSRVLVCCSLLLPALVAGCDAGPTPQLDAAEAWSVEGSGAPPEVSLTLSGYTDGLAELTVSGADAADALHLAGSLSGLGDGPCLAAAGGLCLDIQGPVKHVGTTTADAEGAATWWVAFPEGLIGSEVALQTLAVRGDGGADSVSSSPVSMWLTATCDETHPAWTVGLQSCTPDAAAGYTLFAPSGWTTTYLIDHTGQIVHSWDTDEAAGQSNYLLDDGHLLRPTAGYEASTPFSGGGAGGAVEELDWDGTVLWRYVYASDDVLQHHDIELLPSGNVLLIAWEGVSKVEAMAAGRDAAGLPADGIWPDHVVELDPTTDTIVWEWHVWDHLVQDRDAAKPNYGLIADNPGRLDVNAAGGASSDWNHVNAIDYNAELDQIVLSSHNQHEIWVIDHNTTTEEAAGAAGDFLYRWGNPAIYDSGDAGDQQLGGQHDVQWIAEGLDGAGALLVFNNGTHRGYSSADEIIPPVNPDGSYTMEGDAFGPAGPTWSHAEDDFYGDHISGVQRLANGNTLICEGPSGHLFEVTPEGDTVWTYINPVSRSGAVAQGDPISGNSVFRATRIGVDHAGLQGRDLTPRGTIEL
jgi:hypothetical protein